MSIPRWLKCWIPLALLCLVNSLFVGAVHAEAKLSGDEAFIADVELQPDGTALATWQIAPGYYLYKSKLDFTLDADSAATLGAIELPEGKMKQDPYFGTQEVYYDQLAVTIALQAKQPGPVSLTVKHQGCAERGVCYSPKRNTYPLNLTQASVAPSDNTPNAASGAASSQVQTQESRMAGLLQEGHLLTILGVFFLGGLALTFTPCVLPMVPILSSIIVGQKRDLSRLECFSLSASYVLGMAATYAVLGTILGVAGNNIIAYLQNPWVISVFAALFVLLSLSMFGLYELRLPQGLENRLNNLNTKQQGGTYAGSLVMGVLSAFVVSPCVSAPLAGALVYISTTQGGALLGGSALFALGLGMGVPLLIIGTGGAHLIPRAGGWMNGVKALFGVMLLAVAIWFLDRVVPSAVTMALWGALLLGCGIYLGGLDFGAKQGWAQLRKAIGFGAVVYGCLLWIGVASGGENPLQPLANSRVATAPVEQGQPAAETINEQFVTVTTQAALDDELRRAVDRGEPVFVDFFAEWCVSCKVMEHKVFPHSEVESRLSQFHLVRADVTDNNEMLEHYQLFGPPSLLFFAADGQPLKAYSIRSEIHADELAPHLETVINVAAAAPASDDLLAQQ